jgi:hypothetical protein
VWDAFAPALTALFAPAMVPVHRIFFAERDAALHKKALQRRALRRPGARVRLRGALA